MDATTRQPWLIMSDSRIGRLRYFAYGVTITLLCLPLIAASVWLRLSGHLLLGGLTSIFYGLIANIFGIAFAIRRLHDMNARAWWALISVPAFLIGFAHGAGWHPHGAGPVLFFLLIYVVLIVYACVLLFTPGSLAANRFGPPPPPNSGWVVAGAVSGISLPFVACTAGVIIPAYQVNAIRAQVTDGMQTGFAAQRAILDYVGVHQAWPADLKTAFPQAAQSPVSRYVSEVDLTGCAGNRCSLTVSFDDGNSDRRIQGATLELWTEDGGSTWHCGPGRDNPVNALYLPAACRETSAP